MRCLGAADEAATCRAQRPAAGNPHHRVAGAMRSAREGTQQDWQQTQEAAVRAATVAAV